MRRAYELLKSLIPTPSNPSKAAATAPLPFLSPVMPVFGHASGSSGGIASAKAITPPDTYIPAKAQPAALTRATQAALLPPKAIGAAPSRGTARASSQPVPIFGTA